jgi:hypothetical protein
MTQSSQITSRLTQLRDQWLAQWPAALAAWSRFVQLSAPRWCVTTDDERREELSGSFAMIRLVDHAIIISLRQVLQRGLERLAWNGSASRSWRTRSGTTSTRQPT